MLKTTAIVLGWAVLLCLTLNTPSFSEDSLPIPMDSIPKLSESFELTNYKTILSKRTLLPDRITVDSTLLYTGMSETAITNRSGDTIETIGKPLHRTRAEQWQHIREILVRDNSSTNYYTLADVYYNKQLYGWFKRRDRRVEGVGVIRICLHADKENGPYHVWLLQILLDPIPDGQVQYKRGSGLILVRPGPPHVEWDINHNHVKITSDE